MTNVYLVACPNLGNMVLIDADDESDAAEAAAMELATLDPALDDESASLAAGEYVVYALASYNVNAATIEGGAKFTADKNGELTN